MYILIMSVLILVFKFVNLEKIYNALLYIGSIIIALVNSMYSFLSILSSVKYKNKRRDMWYEVINIAVSIVSLILIINI